MKQSLALIIFTFAFLQICRGQSPARDSLPPSEFYNKEFKWKISIPHGFDTLSTALYTGLEKEGVKGLQKVSHDSIAGGATRICAYKSSIFNYFEANHFLLDPDVYGGFYQQCKKNDDDVCAYYKSILFTNAKMDTTISDEKVDNLLFRKFKLQVSLNDKIILNMYVYSRLFDKEEFSMVIVYVNESKGNTIMNAWRSSKFGQN